MYVKILFVTGRYPYPPLKGDQLRAFHQIEFLARRHSIVLVSFTEGRGSAASDPLPQLCTEVVTVKTPGIVSRGYGVLSSLVRGWPLQNGLYRSTEMRSVCTELMDRSEFDAIVVQLMRMVPYVGAGSQIPVVVDLIDSMGLNMSLRVARARVPLERWFWKREQNRSSAYERRVCRGYAASIVVSERDRRFIAVEDVAVIPNGVAMSAFEYHRAGREPDRIAFWGNLRYFANRDAVRVLVREIMPKIWKKVPNTVVDVIGAFPPRALVRSHDARVLVPGFVNDLPSRAGAATIGVFPIFEASGIQNKVLEALSSGLPVVTTPGVLEGIGARPGVDVLVGRTAEELAVRALELLNDGDLRDRIARNGRRLVQQRYTWERSAGTLERLILGHAGKSARSPERPDQPHGDGT